VHPPSRVVISLGSNLGDRAEHLAHAIDALSRDLTQIEVSPFIDTEPVDVDPGQPRYLNAVVVGFTSLSARRLLDRLMEIEQQRGRTRPYPMAARTLDLDLILYGDEVIDEEGLTVPHPRFRTRGFVLKPLAAIAGALVDPVSGLSVQRLLERLHAIDLRGSG
jgi:2-amino-4-hydroxy-6-hydroxymethyldihydropteridine diphosphokinase